MARVLRRDYSKLTRNLSGYRRVSAMFAPTIPGKVSNNETNQGVFRRRTTTSRSRVEPRERLDPLCKRGKPCPSATSACRSSAEDARSNAGGSSRPRHSVGAGLVVLLVALWTAPVHAGAAEGKLLAQRIIAESWPELVSACRLGLTLKPRPEWDTPPDGALRARCLNGAKSG